MRTLWKHRGLSVFHLCIQRCVYLRVHRDDVILLGSVNEHSVDECCI